MLSDICSDVVVGLNAAKGRVPDVKTALDTFLEELKGYSTPEFSYPTAVLSALQTSCLNAKKSRVQLKAFKATAEAVRKHFDDKKSPSLAVLLTHLEEIDPTTIQGPKLASQKRQAPRE